MIAVREDIGLMRKIGTSTIDKIDARQTVLLSDFLCSEMLLNRDGIVCASFHTANVRIYPLRIEKMTYVLSLATIMHMVPSTVPIPVTIPPAGTSSPGYTSWPARADNSRKEVPGSTRAVMRL